MGQIDPDGTRFFAAYTYTGVGDEIKAYQTSAWMMLGSNTFDPSIMSFR